MSIVPAVFIVVGLYALNHFEPSNMTVLDFVKYLILYTVLYIPLFLIFSINKEEKDLLLYPVLLIIRRLVRK